MDCSAPPTWPRSGRSGTCSSIHRCYERWGETGRRPHAPVGLPAVERRVPLLSCVGTIIQGTSCRTHLTEFSEVELFVHRLCRRSSLAVLSWLFRISCSICSRETPRVAACNTQDIPTVQTSRLMTLPQYVMSSGRTVEIANG